MAKLLIQQISADETRDLRGQIMRPGEPIENSVYPGDDSPDTLHLGAYVDGEQVGVASVYREDPPDSEVLPPTMPLAGLWRLRSIATAQEARGQGYGGKLLQACIGYVAAQGGSALWCNARLNAVWFYERYMFQRYSNVQGTQGHVRYFMWRGIKPSDARKFRLIHNASPDQVLSAELQHVMRAFVQENAALRDRLVEAGIDARDAEEWTLHPWEMLNDWQDRLLQFAAILNSADTERIPQALHEWATNVLYGTGSHLDYHMKALQRAVEPYMTGSNVKTDK